MFFSKLRPYTWGGGGGELDAASTLLRCAREPHLLEHQLHLLVVNEPAPVLVVQIEREHDERRLTQRAVVPERDHELAEVNLTRAVLVKDAEDALRELGPLQLQVLQKLPRRNLAGQVLVDLHELLVKPVDVVLGQEQAVELLLVAPLLRVVGLPKMREGAREREKCERRW